jgi:hypothetical protein
MATSHELGFSPICITFTKCVATHTITIQHLFEACHITLRNKKCAPIQVHIFIHRFESALPSEISRSDQHRTLTIRTPKIHAKDQNLLDTIHSP